ncbi:MAG: gliding motility protein GldM, partial [Bacteroidia bacterium]|nr:gliding motility protein GldM [Bacteroidia bacterium]
MAKTKLSPRQKMINMMYLVLLALLALNVDKHVLKAFHLMEKNFLSSSESYDRKNQNQMAGFFQLMEKEEVKAKPYYSSAKEAQAISQEFNGYISDLKREIEELYDGRLEMEEGEDGLTSLKMPEGMEKHANFFMVKNRGKKAKELQEKINTTRDKLLNLLLPTNDSLFYTEDVYLAVKQANLLKAEEPSNASLSKKTWASINLEYQPVGALMALLTQYQNNAKALEADVIRSLMEGVHADNFVIDQLDAAIIPRSNYVMEGENYEADVMMIARNSASQPEISMNGAPLQTIEQGIGKLSFTARGIGEKTVKGEITVRDPRTNEPKQYPYEHTYQVFKPVATVSADKLNLLYVDLDNPLSISVPGFSAADISVKASRGASISGSNGTYNVKVDGSARKVSITVTAGGRNMGTTEYRVRNVPEPNGQIG